MHNGGGRGWTRTNVSYKQRSYSPPSLPLENSPVLKREKSLQGSTSFYLALTKPSTRVKLNNIIIRYYYYPQGSLTNSSYPIKIIIHHLFYEMVSPNGIEPLTRRSSISRSTNWATGTYLKRAIGLTPIGVEVVNGWPPDSNRHIKIIFPFLYFFS